MPGTVFFVIRFPLWGLERGAGASGSPLAFPGPSAAVELAEHLYEECLFRFGRGLQTEGLSALHQTTDDPAGRLHPLDKLTFDVAPEDRGFTEVDERAVVLDPDDPGDDGVA